VSLTGDFYDLRSNKTPVFLTPTEPHTILINLLRVIDPNSSEYFRTHPLLKTCPIERWIVLGLSDGATMNQSPITSPDLIK
jgi:hypothetical protein